MPRAILADVEPQVGGVAAHVVPGRVEHPPGAVQLDQVPHVGGEHALETALEAVAVLIAHVQPSQTAHQYHRVGIAVAVGLAVQQRADAAVVLDGGLVIGVGDEAAQRVMDSQGGGSGRLPGAVGSQGLGGGERLLMPGRQGGGIAAVHRAEDVRARIIMHALQADGAGGAVGGHLVGGEDAHVAQQVIEPGVAGGEGTHALHQRAVHIRRQQEGNVRIAPLGALGHMGAGLLQGGNGGRVALDHRVVDEDQAAGTAEAQIPRRHAGLGLQLVQVGEGVGEDAVVGGLIHHDPEGGHAPGAHGADGLHDLLVALAVQAGRVGVGDLGEQEHARARAVGQAVILRTAQEGDEPVIVPGEGFIYAGLENQVEGGHGSLPPQGDLLAGLADAVHLGIGDGHGLKAAEEADVRAVALQLEILDAHARHQPEHAPAGVQALEQFPRAKEGHAVAALLQAGGHGGLRVGLGFARRNNGVGIPDNALQLDRAGGGIPQAEFRHPRQIAQAIEGREAVRADEGVKLLAAFHLEGFRAQGLLLLKDGLQGFLAVGGERILRHGGQGGRRQQHAARQKPGNQFSHGRNILSERIAFIIICLEATVKNAGKTGCAAGKKPLAKGGKPCYNAFRIHAKALTEDNAGSPTRPREGRVLLEAP